MNKLTPEILAMYEALQPLFREKMGPLWLPGDRGVTIYRGDETLFLVYAAYDGGLLSGVVCTMTDNFGKVNFQEDDPALLRLPLPIDPVNPERGLWGMVDWKSYELITTSAGELAIWGRTMKRSICTAPTEALLKALMAQEEL